MNFEIPCETYVRLTNVLHSFGDDANEWFNSVRIDNGVALASNRKIMAIENIGGPSGVVHIINDPILIEQCRKEAVYGSKLTIIVNEQLSHAVAKTTLGYIHPGNCAIWSLSENLINNWRKVIDNARKPLAASTGAMFWNADDIARLASSSPSGRIVFETFINATTSGDRPTILNDVIDHNWLGIFAPWRTDDATYEPAKLPNWI